MNIQEIKKQFPEAYKAIFDEGSTVGYQAGYQKGAQEWCEAGRLQGEKDAATKERARITGIQSAMLPGQEALAAKFIGEGATVEAAALGFVSAYKETLNQHRDAFNADGTPIIPGSQDNDLDAKIKTETKDFEALVSEYIEANKCSRGDAIAAIARAYPEVHQAYLDAANKKGGK